MYDLVMDVTLDKAPNKPENSHSPKSYDLVLTGESYDLGECGLLGVLGDSSIVSSIVGNVRSRGWHASSDSIQRKGVKSYFMTNSTIVSFFMYNQTTFGALGGNDTLLDTVVVARESQRKKSMKSKK